MGGSLAVSGATQSVQYGNLKVTGIRRGSAYYTYDVTGYVAQQLATAGDNTTDLFYFPAYDNSFNRLVVGDPQNGKGKTFSLKYIIYRYKPNKKEGTARYLLVSAITLLCWYKGMSQNTSSPYSIIGIGDLEESYFNRTSGMAFGVAYRNKLYLINNNPASCSALQERFCGRRCSKK